MPTIPLDLTPCKATLPLKNDKHMKRSILLAIIISIYTFGLQAQIPEKPEDISPLLIGEKVPEATLQSPDGKDQQLSDILKQKPSVILFYRGGWCPYCNAHLSEIQKIEKQVVELGYQIIAISPDVHENLQFTDEKHQLSYQLLSDAKGELIQNMGIAFKSPERYTQMLFEKSDGINTGFLPFPSVFITDTSRTIHFEYINPNYQTRLSSNLLLAILRELEVKE